MRFGRRIPSSPIFTSQHSTPDVDILVSAVCIRRLPWETIWEESSEEETSEGETEGGEKAAAETSEGEE